MIESALRWLLDLLALPQVGLSSIFLISFVSATLLPLGSEPAVFAVAKANSDLFWPVILVATVGNTLGGAVDYWMGYTARQTITQERVSRWAGYRWFGWLHRLGAKSMLVFSKQSESRWYARLERFGSKTMLLAWLPGIGDPICTLAGWLRLPFWSSVFYMAIGKFLRYLTMTTALLHVPDGIWLRVIHLLG